MAKIEFFALGGLDERGKDCYALTVNGDIYIINSGIITPPSVSLGVKKIIPDFIWINQNKPAIKGIFIGTPSYDRFGSLEFFYQFIPNIPVYTSSIGAVVLNTYFQKRAPRHGQNPLKLNIRIMESLKTERIGACQITPFKVSNSMPRSLGFIFGTLEGSIIYIDDFILSSNKNYSFDDEITEINKITNHKNLMLIIGVGLSGRSKGFTNPNHRIASYFESIILDAPGRVLAACYDYDVYKVLGLVQAAMSKNRPINIYSNTFIELFKFLNDKGYFLARKAITIGDESLDTADNAVVIITGTPQRLFPKLDKIVSDDDPKLHLKETDTFIFAENTIPGYESSEADVFDGVARADVQHIYKLPKNILPVSASNEDHKYLVETLQPKYIIPVSGLYMDFVEYQKAILQTGYSKQNILILENGQCISLNNGILEPRTKFVNLEQQYIGTQGVLDVGASSMFERDQMKDNGVVLVSLLYSKEDKIIKRFNYDSVGVTNITEENKPIINIIVEECNKQISSLLSTAITQNALDMKEIKISIRKIVDKQFEKKFNKKPLVLTTIIFNKNHNQPQP
ncbi:MAG: ribonuclease J [Mycoplasmataceae bacterium]|jgi:ribonuclease J|nr:ribonuclease J [Mycoplasmataceae bacterium]